MLPFMADCPPELLCEFLNSIVAFLIIKQLEDVISECTDCPYIDYGSVFNGNHVSELFEELDTDEVIDFLDLCLDKTNQDIYLANKEILSVDVIEALLKDENGEPNEETLSIVFELVAESFAKYNVDVNTIEGVDSCWNDYDD